MKVLVMEGEREKSMNCAQYRYTIYYLSIFLSIYSFLFVLIIGEHYQSTFVLFIYLYTYYSKYAPRGVHGRVR